MAALLSTQARTVAFPRLSREGGATAEAVLLEDCGAYHLAAEKRSRFPPDSLDAPAAGVAVAVAAVLLVAYEEPPEAGAVHRGVDPRCSAGGPLASLGLAYAAAAALLLLGAALADARRRPRRGGDYELAARADDWPAPADDGDPP